MDKKILIQNLRNKMDGALKILANELSGLRTGRASVNLLDPVVVEAYGSRMPLSQVATVSAPDARSIVVQVWDKSMAKLVEKAIVDANLGLNPISDAQMIRLPIPPLNEERRKELVKLSYKYGENSKISIRNVRRDGLDELKKFEKEVAKDEVSVISEEIQKLTNDYIKKIDEITKTKEIEILKI